MSDYGTMVARIAADTRRADLTSSIGVHIKSAIQHFDPNVSFYNQEHASATITSQEYVALPTGYTSLREIEVSVAGNERYPLYPKNNEWFNKFAGSSHVGDPIFYNVTDYQLRLYPIPTQTSTLTMSYYRELTAVSATADTNKWFTIGELLIRSKATEYLYRYRVHDYVAADHFLLQAERENIQMQRRGILFSTEKIRSWM